MMKNIKIVFMFLMFAQSALAISLDWSGGYRVEYNSVTDPTLDSHNKGSKNYALNFLYLSPHIVGSDGINIVSRFDVMSNQTPAYKNSQEGALIGGGLNDGTGATGSNASSDTQNSTSLQVSELYLNVNQEYGSLLVGRTPIDFGIGITHNAGRGPFDHWKDTKDVISYRFVVDNISFAPMLARVSQSDFGGGVANDQIFILEYNNKDTGSRIGIFHQTRIGSLGTNDYLLSPGSEIASATQRISGQKIQTVNVFLERDWPGFDFKVEASFLTGTTGLADQFGNEIKQNAYAVVAEALIPAQESKWEWSGKFGVVSGDNPNTTQYEGYQLDRNYDVAILLFNHRLGQADFLGTGPLHANDSLPGNNLSVKNSLDDEAISNAMFLAPAVKYSWDEKLDLKGSLIYAQLMENTNNFVDFKKDLGLELDMEVLYRPRERVTWSTGVGVLFPGSAWQGGDNNFSTSINYGFTTKAAITF